MVTYHGIAHTHNTAQDLNQSPNLSHPMQHSNSLHTNLNQPHTTHPSSTSYNNHHRKSSNDNDEEAIARKKKNADAQAAFRQRRQTYIKVRFMPSHSSYSQPSRDGFMLTAHSPSFPCP
jgi:hypothetical protein